MKSLFSLSKILLILSISYSPVSDLVNADG